MFNNKNTKTMKEMIQQEKDFQGFSMSGFWMLLGHIVVMPALVAGLALAASKGIIACLCGMVTLKPDNLAQWGSTSSARSRGSNV